MPGDINNNSPLVFAKVLAMSLIGLLMSVTCLAEASGMGNCEPVGGPMTWDYQDQANWKPSGDAPQTRIKLVENVHFNQDVESLRRGNTTVDPLGDIAYTLRRFPNHTRALWAVSRYWRTERNKAFGRRAGVGMTAECAFYRARQFKPQDGAVRLVFAAHLQAVGDLREAREQYQVAQSLGVDSADFHYNFALLLFDMEQYEEAKDHAKKAYALGHPLPGLRNKLIDAGIDFSGETGR